MLTTMKSQGITAIALLVTAVACGPGKPPEPPPAAPSPAEPVAPVDDAAPDVEEEEPQADSLQTRIMAKSESKLEGTVTMTPTADGVEVVVSVSHVEPGQHGVHIHEKPDCSAADGTSAGGHFNPDGHDHALPEGSPSHLGDLGNIEVKADGTGILKILRKGANLKPGDAHSFADRALIVHAKVDDGGQPTGNAGGRIGCAELRVIGTPGT